MLRQASFVHDFDENVMYFMSLKLKFNIIYGFLEENWEKVAFTDFFSVLGNSLYFLDIDKAFDKEINYIIQNLFV